MRELLLHHLESENPTKSSKKLKSYKSSFEDVNCELNSNLANMVNKRITSGDIFCSFEVSPPKSKMEKYQLLKSIRNLQDKCCPLFTAVTWHLVPTLTEGSIRSFTIKPRAMNFAAEMKNLNSVLLHLSSIGLTQWEILFLLHKAKSIGIKNIFALRGDIPKTNSMNNFGDFPYAANLVSFIRENFGNYFTICVAGYPTGHPDAESLHQDLIHLKEKVDAGADFIITQFFFQADDFTNFVHLCREFNISVPIIASIMSIQSYNSLLQISRLCRVQIPAQVLHIVKSVRHNDEAIRKYGIYLAVQMASHILSRGLSAGIHIFTLNRDLSAIEICKNLGFYPQQPQIPL